MRPSQRTHAALPRVIQPFLNRIPVPDLPGRQGRGEKVLLELDLTRGLAEAAGGSPLAAIRAMRTPQLAVVIDHLRKACQDDAVAGLIGIFGGEGLSLAQSGELRDAVSALRASGRPTLAWAGSFGDLTPQMPAYHLATAFEQIWLQPSGAVGIMGFSAEPLFVRSALDKLGVEPQFGHRHEYKSAVETFTRSSASEPNREMLQRLLASATEIFCADVAQARGLSPDDVRALIARAPLSAQDALEATLIDQLGYRDQAYAAIRAKLGGLEENELRMSFVERYGSGRLDALREQVHGVAAKVGGRAQVAVIQAVGAIVDGRPQPSPFGGSSVGSESLGAVLRAAGRAEQVRAVVLRVDSPGGSYTASDALRREVKALREKGIPVIASMASVAASGGYFISMGCDKIVANPGTITGSIGVLAGKAVTRDAFERIGVNRESITTSPRADMFSTNRSFDDDERAVLEAWLDEVYADFVAKVAQDRAMSTEQVHEVARGRVWTGADALERGLVDRLGGLDTAIGWACELAELDRERVDVRVLPKASPLELFFPGENSDAVQSALSSASGLAVERALPELGLLSEAARRLLGSPKGVLSLPAIHLPGLIP